MAEPLLTIRGAHGGYGDVQVLWGVDLEVMPGEIACLVGSNGAGKTTLMRLMSGLVRASAGEVQFAGRAITNAKPGAILAGGLAHVPEGRRLFSAMSVRDNLLMGAYHRYDPAPEIKQDLDRVYAIFPILADRSRQAAGTLSGGEQQMCAIARGIMSLPGRSKGESPGATRQVSPSSAPRLLLIDELSLGLAPRMVDVLVEALVRINREGISLLVVEQDVGLALELASRAFVMDSGRITRAGPSATLRDDPAIREAYLGSV